MDLQIGQQIDRYIVEAILGEGACGVVYRVRHARLGSQHALKVLLRTPRAMQIRLAQEGQIQAGLRHPNIVPVTDIIDINGTPGLIAEYIDGSDLDEWRRLNRPSPEAAERIFRQLLAGLAYAHSHGIIHRDLKPSNILVAHIDGEPVARITDFGIAKVLSEDSPELTRSQASMGSPRYMPPEQWRSSRDVDVRADVFAMGCILYELLCGQPAFDGDNLPDIFQAAAAERYTDPEMLCDGISPALRATIIGCLRADREQRLPDCAAVLRSLNSTPPIETPLQIIEDAPTPQTLLPSPSDLAAETLAPLLEDELEELPAEDPPDVASPTRDTLTDTRSRGTLWPLLGALGLSGGLALGAGLLMLIGLVVVLIGIVPDPTSTPVHAPITAGPAPEAWPEVSPTVPPVMPVMPPAAHDSGEDDTAEEHTPAAAEAPPAAPRTSRVSAVGTAEAVWLMQGSRRTELGEVPPGRYQIYATFAGSTVPAGAVSLRAGERVTLKCEDLFQQCRREEL